MKATTLKPLALAVGLALAAPAFAVNLDFSGTNLYMKFLDGDRRVASTGGANTPGGSGDTASGTDQGQWAEFELRIKAQISRQVEAGIRLQSRSSAAYWTDFGGFGDQDLTPTRANYLKARGPYVLLTPAYGWLDQALIGASDWGMFDPFTLGKLRYIDRDNVKGFYFKGGLYGGGSWEAARVSLPNYLQANFGQGPSCCGTDDTQFNEALYIGQLKRQIGPVSVAASYQQFRDHILGTDNGNVFDGRGRDTFAKNNVLMLKGALSPWSGADLRAAYYRSEYKQPLFDQPWTGNPKSSINDDAYKVDLDITSLPVPGLAFNLQYFNIGAGYHSNTAARRESDVLLTEGSEAAWYNWGQSIWLGGAAKDFHQGPASPKNLVNKPSANGLADNDLIDFDESPVESVIGWKGFTVLASYEFASTPLSFEFTQVDYNNNWRNYSPTGPLSNFFALNQDRKTNIYAFKASRVWPVLGGLDTSFKWKKVDDKDDAECAVVDDTNPAAPPAHLPCTAGLLTRETSDDGITLSVGNQLFSHLYGSFSYGNYKRDVTRGSANFDNKKDIYSLRFTYNLAGFELGSLAQWIKGDGNPTQTAGGQVDIKQYRLKAYAKVIF